MYHYFRCSFPMNPHTEKLLIKIRPAAEEYLDSPIESLPYSTFKLYHQTGSRVEYEAQYIAHRRRMNVLTVMALAEPDQDRWLSALEDILWAICDEYTWALPAHVPADQVPDQTIHNLDLFHTETAGALAEILDLLGDRLHVEVRNRIVFELRRRTFEPFLAKSHRSYGNNNWAAVCACGAATAIMRMGTKEEAMTAIAHADELIENFLSGFEDDGCCLEGPLYWRYGFGYFCYYADMVRAYTKGEHDWFQHSKVKTIAEFPNKFHLQDQFVIPFADASHEEYVHIGLFHFLAKEYGALALPDESFELLLDDDPRHRTMELLRDIYWYEPDFTQQSNPLPNAYDLTDSQWYIRRESGLAFAAKGGHNAEPHNHNDIGSFILFDNGRYILDDLGWPEYDKWYFTDARSSYICAGSQGHNLPIIDGKTQLSGRDHSCTVTKWTDTIFALDISSAYGLPAGTVHRSLSFAEGTLSVTDTFRGCQGMELRERFVTRIHPETNGSCFHIADWLLAADKACRTQISQETFTPRLSCCKQDKMKPVETAYLLDFVFIVDSDEWSTSITISPCK